MSLEKIILPDLGSTSEVTIIEMPIQVGSDIEKEATLMTLEGEKASMDVPSPYSGKITELKVKVGDKVKTGDFIGMMETSDIPLPVTPVALHATEPLRATSEPLRATDIHAGPAVRMLARELGIDLNKLKGSGHKGRITKDDLINHIKQAMAGGSSALPAPPQVDFAQYGSIKEETLSRIKQWTSTNLHRNWVLIPHVTQFDDADITDLEAYRKSELDVAKKQGYKLTLLPFVMKACVSALQKYPQFNASLSTDGHALILKQYYHIGVAVDTDEGLVVPVIRDVDKKGLMELAKELAEASEKARNKQLKPKDMQGSSFTISSLGGIGGTAFTPIVNMPDVAILGLSRAYHKPVYRDEQFIPRLVLPLSLSYDHRVIDGAEGARFITYLSSCLNDIRTVLL